MVLNIIENTLGMERVKICLHYGTRVWFWVWSLSLRQNHSSSALRKYSFEFDIFVHVKWVITILQKRIKCNQFFSIPINKQSIIYILFTSTEFVQDYSILFWIL